MSTLIPVHCAQCVVEFGITRELYSRRQSDGKSFTCPNGHGNVFTKGKDEEDESPPDEQGPPADEKETFKFDPIKIH